MGADVHAAVGQRDPGLRVRPWFANIAKFLCKEPKWFLRDWSGIDDAGARAETLAACHLLTSLKGGNAPHGLQVVMDLPYHEANCFAERAASVMPARTSLSQSL